MTELKKAKEAAAKKASPVKFLDEVYRKTTLGDLGNQLPIQPLGSDEKPLKDRSFNFLPWNMETEEKVSEYMADAKDIGTPINKMMALLVDDLCGEDFSKLDETQKCAKINSLDFANVMYMYMFLRTEELGMKMKMEVTCPHCSNRMKNFQADLATLEIHCKDHNHKRERDYELVRPFKVGDEMVTNIVFNHSKWFSMAQADVEIAQSPGKMKRLMLDATMIKAYSHKSPDKFIDRREVLKNIKKVDIEQLGEQITDNDGGPLLAVEGKCNKCRKTFARALDWTYQYFFASSSL